MNKNPPLKLLQTFESVIRNSSISKAADELCVTQSAVSHAIKLLSEIFQIELLNKEGRGIKPTELAKEYATDLNRIFKDIRYRTENFVIKSHQQTTLKITAPSIFITQYLVKQITLYNRKYPHVITNISSPQPTNFTIALEDLNIDLLITYQKQPHYAPEYTQEKIIDDCLFPFISSSYYQSESIEEIMLKHPLIEIDVPDKKNLWDQWIKYKKIKVDKAELKYLKLQETNEAISALLATDAIALVDKRFVKNYIDTGVITQLDEQPMLSGAFYFVYSSKNPKIAYISALIETIKQSF